MKYLITGLGNPGREYENTRHNIGFSILDALVKASNIAFEDRRYGWISRLSHRGRTYVLLKPSTYMNLSGRAVHYWLKKEKIPLERLLVVVDDVALPFGVMRLRAKGSDAGHNGLNHISTILGTQNYARLRFGIGDNYGPGQKVEYVLGPWSAEEKKLLPERIELAGEIILQFGVLGVERTMNLYNQRGNNLLQKNEGKT
ncbi:MAG TPA: aminoacyl-tRNA hydrolase [Bacteroidetes bacterium]|nr:aminoacyl-tRNA hydrolase [Bacteroidota bacterium]